MNENTIKQTLQKGERVSLECKKAQSSVPNSVWETYSAFANTNGGLILLGVFEDVHEKDLNKRFTIIGEETKARNQRIQNMFRMIGFGENLGSGFPLILSAWNEKHWLKPELVEQPELLQVKLILTVETKKEDSFMPKDGKKDGIKELVDNQVAIIKLITQDGTITSAVLAQKTGLSQRTLMRELAALQKKGLLAREGGRKNGRWVIIPQNEPLEKQQENRK